MIIKAGLRIGLSGCDQDDVLEIDDSELEGMSDDERTNYIDKEVREWAFNYIDIFWSEVKEVQNENNVNSQLPVMRKNII